MKTCADCEKQTQDLFYLNYNELVDPFTGTIKRLGNGFCLSCYKKMSNTISRGDCYVL